MSSSGSSSNLLGGDPGQLAVGVCVLVAVGVMVPFGLASIGFGAILSAAGGSGTTSPVGTVAPLSGASVIGTTRMHPQAEPAAALPAGVTSSHGLIAGWTERGPLNQYARASYASDQSWLTWRDADCSAASLEWLLGAYGQHVANLDEAIALVAPGTGISTSLGLLDARGTALARALLARGLQPRTPGQRPLGSIAELQSWLNQGPLLMDGAR